MAIDRLAKELERDLRTFYWAYQLVLLSRMVWDPLTGVSFEPERPCAGKFRDKYVQGRRAGDTLQPILKIDGG